MKSLQKLQEEQKKLLTGIEHPRLGNTLGLFEEVGELSKEIMEIEMYEGSRQEELEDEAADVLFSLFSICDSYNIDLQSAYSRKIEKINKKIPEWHEKYGARLKQLREKFD
ncbi:MAG: MazG nucleotide pyrophosphohydrolase domain-containing protein [Patescibacteria group bacterium]